MNESGHHTLSHRAPLNLACQLGLGTNRLDEIEDVRYPFEPSQRM
jgi:hypothetical protein